MEFLKSTKFTSTDEDAEFLAKLAVDLCEHKRGAWLEKGFDRLDEQASALIAEIMDECDKSNTGSQALIF